MKGSASLALAALAFLLTACPQAVTPPEPPVTPDPDPATFPVTEISGTLLNWTGGEAYLTLTSGYSVSSDGETEEVVFGAPAYQTALSADGTFALQLGLPQSSELTPLTCGNSTYPLGLLVVAAVSSVPEPAGSDAFLGGYTLGPADSLTTDAVWVYSAAALELDASCTLPGSSPADLELVLAPGWNQAILTQGETVRLESGAVPASFVWSQF